MSTWFVDCLFWVSRWLDRKIVWQLYHDVDIPSSKASIYDAYISTLLWIRLLLILQSALIRLEQRWTSKKDCNKAENTVHPWKAMNVIWFGWTDKLLKSDDCYDCMQANQRERVWKQGRIHGYRSRVRVGRGHIWGHQTIWAGAVRSKK